MIQRILNLRLQRYAVTIQETVLAARESSSGSIEALKSWGIALVDRGLHLQMDINPYIGDRAVVKSTAKAHLSNKK